MDNLNKEPISVEAVFMQYAYGDWNDDMKIKKWNDTLYNFLLEKDIDPLFLNGEDEIRGWLFDNETPNYGRYYKLTGYVSKCAKFGCDSKTPKFWITKIEKMDGSSFDTSGIP